MQLGHFTFAETNVFNDSFTAKTSNIKRNK